MEYKPWSISQSACVEMEGFPGADQMRHRRLCLGFRALGTATQSVGGFGMFVTIHPSAVERKSRTLNSVIKDKEAASF